MAQIKRRTQSVIKVEILTDRYQSGEIVLRPIYTYADDSEGYGAAHRCTLGKTAEDSAAQVWDFMFACLADMQEEAPHVVLRMERNPDDGWSGILVTALALAAAHELGITVVQTDAAQLPLFNLVA